MRFLSLNGNDETEVKLKYTNCYYCGEQVELNKAGVERKNKLSCDKIYVCERHKRIKVNKIKLKKRK